ncbi:MAG: TetR/AcrR family transcriptional regulator [Bacteroidales bacterium]|nr:TetR/AcrR family transcriptional regulator [Bacteroidales bacterium]
MNDTKEHILNIALKLFLQKNFKEVTMKEIVNKTGLSKGAFYHYFKSKEQLFGEVIDNYFSLLISDDYNDSKVSLYEFYHDRINKINSFSNNSSENIMEYGEDVFNINFFSLIFDALKMFPGFRKKMEDYHKKELNAWSSAIKRAKVKGEIKSSLTDKQIAMIFIYTSDGLAMNLTLNSNIKNLKKEIKPLWDKFYDSMKV